MLASSQAWALKKLFKKSWALPLPHTHKPYSQVREGYILKDTAFEKEKCSEKHVSSPYKAYFLSHTQLRWSRSTFSTQIQESQNIADSWQLGPWHFASSECPCISTCCPVESFTHQLKGFQSKELESEVVT